MSRIGNKPIQVPDGVEVEVGSGEVRVKGPKGELAQAIHPDMEVSLDEGVLSVKRPTDRGPHRALHGLTRSLIANMVTGVTDGYQKHLEIQGVGYRAQAKGKGLELSLGFSHPGTVEPVEGIEFEVPQPTEIVAIPKDAASNASTPRIPPVNLAPSNNPIGITKAFRIAVLLHAVKRGPTMSALRGTGAMRSRS